MISKNKIKYIKSLELKKNRNQEFVFVAEGPKIVEDILAIMPAIMIVATEEWKGTKKCEEFISVNEDELRKVSFLQHPQQVLAVFKQSKETKKPNDKDLYLALDGVQDPGNLGTIIRIADWFGIKTIYCSYDTADVYNPKAIQATMGSIAHVSVVYTDLKELIESLPKDYPVYGTMLNGKNIYNTELTDYGMIVMGNEGKGISQELQKIISHKLLIPNYPLGQKSSDSLNVAIATAITCAEFRRRS